MLKIVLALAFSVMICVGVSAGSNPQLPIRTAVVTMNDGMQAGFLGRLQSFAEKHAFAIRIAQSTPNELDAIVQMWREDIKVIGRSLPSSQAGERVFKISFYSNDTEVVPAAVIIAMMSDLERAANETDGARYQVK